MPDKKSVEEFAKSIKDKYPQYASMDDLDLVKKITSKYPQYSDSVDFDLKKKDLSGQDSKTPVTPLSSSGITEDDSDYDSQKDFLVSKIKELQRQPTAPGWFESLGEFSENMLRLTGKKVDIPDYKTEADLKIEELMHLGKKAFKKNFIEDNPDVAEDLNSGDEEKIEEAHNKIYEAWVKEPEELSGEEREESERGAIEKIYNAFFEGMKEHDFNNLMARELATATDEEAQKILELEYQRAVKQQDDIQAPVADLISAEGISKMAGTQAEPIATTSAIGVIPGLKPAAVLYSSYDAAATSYGAAFRNTYINARMQGMDENKAYEVANDQAKVEGATGAVEGALGAFTGGFATKFGTKAASKFGNKLLKPIIQKATEGTTDMGVDASAAMVGQIVNNWSAREKGLNVGLFDGVSDEMLGEIIFSGGMKIPGTVKTTADFRKYISALPDSEQQQIFNDVITNKDNIENKIIQDKTNQYLDAKAKELDNKGSKELYDLITSKPIDYLEQERERLEIIGNNIKDETMKSEIEENIQAIELMKNNLSEPDTDTEVVTSKSIEIPAGKKLFNEPNPETINISNEYKSEKGLDTGEGEPITELDVERSKTIADAYEQMEHSPNDPEVKEAYDAMAIETLDQYSLIADKGYTFEVFDGEGEPYKNSEEMINDLKENKHLYILSTKNEFGEQDITDEQIAENPLLQDSGIKDKNGVPLLVNDIFRGVHDFFGHSERGNSFGAIGEENAWDIHARMYSDKARRAMTTETRGQNSWVNFGSQMRNEDGSIKKKGDEGYLSPAERPFAEQKIGLLPEEFSNIEEKYTKVVKGDPVKIDVLPKDTYLNVGMKIGETDQDLSKSDIESKLPEDVDIISSTEVSGTEPTLSLQLSRPLTDVEMKKFLSDTGQDAIPQITNGEGTMFGSLDWGQFSPDYFVMPDGVTLSDKIKQDDKKDQPGIPSKEQIGKKPKQTKPDEKVSESETKTGGVVQEEGKIEEPPKPPILTKRPSFGEDGEKNVNSFSAYARGIIPKAEQYKHEWAPLITALENGADPEVILDKIESVAVKVTEREKKKTKNRIIKIVKNRKSFQRRVGKTWKMKVPPDVAAFVKNIDLNKLDKFSLSEINEIESIVKSMLKSGAQEVRVNERLLKKQADIFSASVLEELVKTEKVAPELVKSEEDLIDKLNMDKYTAVIDGVQINSKNALNEYKKDNTLDLKKVKVYNIGTIDNAVDNASYISSSLRYLNPISGKNNLKNEMLPLSKGSKKNAEMVEDINDSVDDAYFNMNEEKSRKSQKYINDIIKIFSGKDFSNIKSIAGKIISSTQRGRYKWSTLNYLNSRADIVVFDNKNKPITNDEAVDIYSQIIASEPVLKDGKEQFENGILVTENYEKIKKTLSKDEIKSIIDYIDSKPKLKEYSEYLINTFYQEARESYNDTYKHITGGDFPEGAYYPRKASLSDKDVFDSHANLVGEDGETNYRSAVAGNLKDRVKSNSSLNISGGAHRRAMEYLDKMERAKWFIPVGERVNALFSKPNKTMIVRRLGENGYRSLRDHFSVVLTGKDPRKGGVKGITKGVDTLMKIKIYGTLAFKVASSVKQLTSFTHFSVAKGITPIDWIRGFVPSNADESKFMLDIMTSRYVKDRMKGTDLDIEINKILGDKRINITNRVERVIMTVGMSPIMIGDIGGVLLGGVPMSLAYYRKMKSKGMSDLEAKNEAYKKFVSESEHAQQSKRESETSHFQRDNFGRIISNFKTSQTQTTNKLKESIYKLVKTPLTPKEMAREIYNAVYWSQANVLFSILAGSYLSQLFLDDEEPNKDEIKKTLYDIEMDNIQSTLDGLALGGYIANRVLNVARGDEWKNNVPLFKYIDEEVPEGLDVLLKVINEMRDDNGLIKPEEELTEKEITKLFKAVGGGSVRKVYLNQKMLKEDDKEIIEVIMNWSSKKEREGYRPKNDKIYKLLTGRDYSEPKGKSRGGRVSRKSSR